MSIDRAGYISTAVWVANSHNGGGTYDPESFGYPFRFVFHTIEGSANPNMIAGHKAPPHLWYNPATRQLWQTVPLSRSSFAMWQGNGHYTNKARAIQIELHGYSAETAGWPQEWLDNITADVVVPICQWVASVGASIDLSKAPAPGAIGGSAAADAPQRMSEVEWAIFAGLCSHRHVPQNGDRWDTGGLDTPRIAQHAAMIIGGQLEVTPGRTGPQEDDDDMAIIATLRAPGDPQDGSMWAINGLFKRKLASYQEYEFMLATNQVRKQPDGAGWADMNIDQLRTYATVDEWSLAGLPTAVAVAVGQQLPAAVANAVGLQVRNELKDLPQRIAQSLVAAFAPPAPASTAVSPT